MIRRQMFVIDAATWGSLSYDETEATAAAMKEAGVYALPYPEVDMRVPAECVVRWKKEEFERAQNGPAYEWAKSAKVKGMLVEKEFDDGPGYIPNFGPNVWMELRKLSLEHENGEKLIVVDKGNPHFLPHEQISSDKDHPFSLRERDMFVTALIVLLATRNARKVTKQNRLAKCGIGKGIKRYEYVTTISLPSADELEAAAEEMGGENSTPGKTRRPHLRRGHVRRQHYGPRNSLIRSKFIGPIFVNADKDWVDTRVRYNVSL